MERRDTGKRRRTLVAALAAVGSLAAFTTLGGVGLAKAAIGLAQSQYEPGTKVTICHKGKVTITISTSALPAHLAHGDEVEACPPVQATPKADDAEDAEDGAEAEDTDEAEAEKTTKAPKAKTTKAKQPKVKPTKADDTAGGEDAKPKPAEAKQKKAKQDKTKGKPAHTTTQTQAPVTHPGAKDHGNAGGKGHGNAGGDDKSHGNAGGDGRGHGNGKK